MNAWAFITFFVVIIVLYITGAILAIAYFSKKDESEK